MVKAKRILSHPRVLLDNLFMSGNGFHMVSLIDRLSGDCLGMTDNELCEELQFSRKTLYRKFLQIKRARIPLETIWMGAGGRTVLHKIREDLL